LEWKVPPLALYSDHGDGARLQAASRHEITDGGFLSSSQSAKSIPSQPQESLTQRLRHIARRFGTVVERSPCGGMMPSEMRQRL